MKVYLASFDTIQLQYKKNINNLFLLSSFWTYQNAKQPPEHVYKDSHLLDSGAFTAINDKTGKFKNFDWDLYLDKYIKFIKKTNQKKFFELDIDCVVGLKKVEYYRKKMEDAIGIAPIICWHLSRGKEYWIKCCEEYSYVALGTTLASLAGQKIRKNPEILNWFINYAHKNNAKIHGLGFTSIPWLHKLKFDSVDSTAWLAGTRYGTGACKFKSNTIIPPTKPLNAKMKKGGLLNIYNFEEWVKFQQYANNHL
tara:strand:+ start:306 stop:1064 length:759 start_codon:yes stop_codon:yes gene_type:complete